MGPETSAKSPILEMNTLFVCYKYFVDIPFFVNVINNQSLVRDIIVKLFSNKLL